jgi:hypothetical protein
MTLQAAEAVAIAAGQPCARKPAAATRSTPPAAGSQRR